MKKLASVLTILLCAGCNVQSWVIEAAVEKCKDHNGISYLSVPGNVVICNDGSVYSIKLKEGK